ISQASALISTTSSGGESPGASRAGPLVEPRYSLPEKALTPLADHLATRIEPRCDFVVVQPLGGHQNHLGPHDLEVRQRIAGCAPIQFLRFGARKTDDKRALAWHGAPPDKSRISRCHTRPGLSIKY